MAIIIKQKEIAKNVKANIYVKINSVRAGQGENDNITCMCSQWVGVESRESNETEFMSNVAVHIPDRDIVSKGGTLIAAVYPSLQKYYENQGYEVITDNNSYGEAILKEVLKDIKNTESNTEEVKPD